MFACLATRETRQQQCEVSGGACWWRHPRPVRTGCRRNRTSSYAKLNLIENAQGWTGVVSMRALSHGMEKNQVHAQWTHDSLSRTDGQACKQAMLRSISIHNEVLLIGPARWSVSSRYVGAIQTVSAHHTRIKWHSECPNKQVQCSPIRRITHLVPNHSSRLNGEPAKSTQPLRR